MHRKYGWRLSKNKVIGLEHLSYWLDLSAIAYHFFNFEYQMDAETILEIFIDLRS